MFNIALSDLDIANPAISVYFDRLAVAGEALYLADRSDEWIALPDPVSEGISFIVSIASGSSSVSFSVQGAYTVEVVDVDLVPTSYVSGAVCSLQLDYSAQHLAGETTICQYLVKVCAVSGGTITSFVLKAHSTGYSTQVDETTTDILFTNYDIVDIKFNTPSLTYLNLISNKLKYVGFITPTLLLKSSTVNGVSAVNMFRCSSAEYYYGYNAPLVSNLVGSFRDNTYLMYANLEKEINVTTLAECFYSDVMLETVILPISLNYLVDLTNTFSFCTSLTSLNIASAPLCSTMAGMCKGCSNLTQVTFNGGFLLCVSCYEAFSNCKSLRVLTLPNLSNCRTIDYSFYGCSSLTTLNLSTLTSVISLDYAFANCFSLSSVTFPSTLEACTSIYCSFLDCKSLTSIELPVLSLCTDTRYTFFGCVSLREINSINLPRSTSLQSMFKNCSNLNSIVFTNLQACTTLENALSGCKRIESVQFPSLPLCTSMVGTFNGCESLRSLSFNSAQIGWAGVDFSLVDCKMMNNADIVLLFNSLPTITQSRSITLPGVTLSTADITIATNKGWTVVQ